MTKIKLETIAQALIEIKKLQARCKEYRDENRVLKNQLKRFKNLGGEIPDFLKGFNNKRR